MDDPDLKELHSDTGPTAKMINALPSDGERNWLIVHHHAMAREIRFMILRLRGKQVSDMTAVIRADGGQMPQLRGFPKNRIVFHPDAEYLRPNWLK